MKPEFHLWLKNRMRPVWRLGLTAYSSWWKPYSRLFLVPDSPNWALATECREIARVSRRLGIRLGANRYLPYLKNQSIFHASHFILKNNQVDFSSNHVALAYLHGLPHTGFPEFDQVYEGLKINHQKISRIQVTHQAMKRCVLASGIDPKKVHLIPIGVNTDLFTPVTESNRRQVRQELGIPRDAFVIGSFQKDGIGWGKGLDPKWIKGPDLFLTVMERLKPEIPGLFVLLSGPARGYVIQGLEKWGIPYRHVYQEDYAQMGRLYHALDVYLVTSRQEGGPKAVLESMASGIPLVTTAVGQAQDLVMDGFNGFISPVDKTDDLVANMMKIYSKEYDVENLRIRGIQTAQKNCYEAQDQLWYDFFLGFVDIPLP